MGHRKRPLGQVRGQVQSWLHDVVQGVAGQIMCQEESKRIRITVLRIITISGSGGLKWVHQYSGQISRKVMLFQGQVEKGLNDSMSK